MTRARSRTHGLVIPPLSQLSLTAALCVFVSLVQGVVSTLQMIFNRRTRDWHADTAREVLPREKNDISETGTDLGPRANAPRPAVDAQRRTRALHDQAFTPILRDAHFVRPQDEIGGLRRKRKVALMLRDRKAIVSKHEGGLTRAATLPLSLRAKVQSAAVPVPTSDTHSLT